MRIVVTAGPTREYIDTVRFISNASTGLMGYAAAEVAASRGHNVTLISGPSPLEPPSGVRFIRVVSAEQMCEQTLKSVEGADALIMSAAVADFRPADPLDAKLQKEGKQKLTINLVRTPDILVEVAKRRETDKARLVTVGFALEDGVDEVEKATEKLRRKRLDLIVLNSLDSMGAEESVFLLLASNGGRKRLSGSKKRLAEEILDFIEKGSIDGMKEHPD